MKKSWILFFALICAALSVLSVSAAPRDRYYDQLGNKHWCNSDSYGCWVTGENGEHEYIMFWSESARDAIMGPGSKAPLGTNPGTAELPLAAPKLVISTSGGGAANTCAGEIKDSASCINYCQQTTGSSEHIWLDYPDCDCNCTGGTSGGGDSSGGGGHTPGTCTSAADCVDYCSGTWGSSSYRCNYGVCNCTP